MSILLALAWLLPLIASLLAARVRLVWLVPLALVPALVTSVAVPSGTQLELPWLLLGTVLGIDDISRIFLAFTSLLWLAAGLFTSLSPKNAPNGGRFRLFFLLAMTGNLLLILAQDLIAFYLGFSLMGLAAYGLVVHDGTRTALRAGKLYLVMTILGELALFTALVLIAAHADTLVPTPEDLLGLGDLAVGLLLLALGIKAGLVPVHVWLPLAHPAAPIPASAVLSGAMIKVALLGWLKFLPIGLAPMLDWGLLLVIVGMVTMLYALPIGLVQTNPKVILAYSSVSKMGLMALTLGIVLMTPDLAEVGVIALSLFAAHHALAKGGLFLGVGLRHQAVAQGLVLAGIGLLALTLAGAPGTAGAVAKLALEPILGAAGWVWLGGVTTLATVGTALLMGRLLWVLSRQGPDAEAKPAPLLAFIGWGLLITLSLTLALVLGGPATWRTNWMPIATALALILFITLLAWHRRHRTDPAQVLVPPGDLLVLALQLRPLTLELTRRLTRMSATTLARTLSAIGIWMALLGPRSKDMEEGLRDWPKAGVLWLAITAALVVASVTTWSTLEGWYETDTRDSATAAPTPGCASCPISS